MSSSSLQKEGHRPRGRENRASSPPENIFGVLGKKKCLGGGEELSCRYLAENSWFLKGLLALVFMNFYFCLKFLTQEQYLTLYKSIFVYTFSFDAQNDLPEIGMKVLNLQRRN